MCEGVTRTVTTNSMTQVTYISHARDISNTRVGLYAFASALLLVTVKPYLYLCHV